MPFLLYLSLAGFCSRYFPMPNPDEIVDVEVARNLVDRHSLRYSLYDDVFPPDAKSMQDLSNMDGRPLFAAWLGLVVKCFSVDSWRMRWSSVLMGLMVLIFLSRIHPWAPWIVMANPVFWLSTMAVNEHVLLLALCCGLVAWHEMPPQRRLNKECISGTLLGLAFLIHPNALIFLIGYAGFIGAKHKNEKWFSFMGPLGAGFLIGLLMAVNFVNLKRIFLYQHSFFGSFLKPAVLSWPWNPLQWASNVWTLILEAPTYYVQTHFSHDWPWSQRMFWIGSAVAFLGFLISRRRLDRWVIGFMTTFIALTLLFVRQEAVYSLVLLPFLAPLLADVPQRRFRWLSGACLAASACLYFHMVWRYVKLNVPFEQTMTEMKATFSPTEDRVAGPTVLWLANPTSSFRDLGAVMVGRYVTQQPWDLSVWLGSWQPTILVVDFAFRRTYMGGMDDAALLSRRLKAPVSLEKRLNTFAYGPWTVYRVHWPSAKRSLVK